MIAIFFCASIASAETAYNVVLGGSQAASGEQGNVALNLNANGDPPGMLNVTIKHDGANITGGT